MKHISLGFYLTLPLNLLASLIITLAITFNASASPLQTFGLGARSMAMGGASVAIVEDYTSVYYNPAGLSFAQNATIGGGFIYGSPDLRLNDKKEDVDLVRAYQAGLSTPLGSGKLGDVIKLGMVIHYGTNHIFRGLSHDSKVPYYVLYVNLPQRIALVVCGSYQLLPNFSFGGGVEILADIAVNLDLDPLTTTGTFVVFEAPLTIAYAPVFGLKYKPLSSLSLGAAYRGQIDLSVDGRITVLVSGTEVLPVSLTMSNTNKPQEIVVGTAYNLNKRLVVGLDFTWINYEKYLSPSAIVHVESEDAKELEKIFPIEDLSNPLFRDIIIPRIGVEFVINKNFSARGGYFYHPSPVPDQRGKTNYLDSNKHVISIGGGLTFQDPLELMEKPISVNVVVQAHIFEERSVVKDNPTDPNYTIDGEIYLAGIFVKYTF